MKQFLDEHFSGIIERRANKDWRPSLHANADVVAAYPEIAGMAVIEDKYVDPLTIELRAETGKLMASYSGVRIPKEQDPA